MAAANHNIIFVFLQAAAANPERIALEQDGQSITYLELQDEVIATAAMYRSRGIGQGDKVLVAVPMSLPLYRTVLALFYIGACPVFLDEWVSTARLKECLKVVPCKGLIAKRAYLFLALLIKPLRRIPVKIAAGSGHASLRTTAFPPADVAAEDTALVTFTTGSTGTPKAADRTRAYLSAQLAALSPMLSNITGRCMTLLPIVVLLHLAGGRTTILPPRKYKAAKSATTAHLTVYVAGSKPEALIASPAIIAVICEEAAASSGAGLRTALQNVSTVMTGGGPVYPALAAQMLAAFPSAAITAVYGSTEAEPIAHISAEELRNAGLETLLTKGLPVGLTAEAAEVAILRLDAEPAAITDLITFVASLERPGVAGEVIVAGPHVLQHYIGNPLAERETKLRISGKVWHRTGDCGMLDADGRLYLLGRCNERFVWRGRPYYPAIISYALQVMAGVKESALLLIDGQPRFILEKADSAALPEIESCLAELGLPDVAISFVKEIPKDLRHRTKVDNAGLRAMMERHSG